MITVAGLAPSLDLTYCVDALRIGRIHRPTETVRVAGGKPLNLARAAAALGAEVAVVCVLGGRTGDWLAEELDRSAITVDRVPTPYPTRTCVSISSGDSDELTEVYEYAEPIPDDVWAVLRGALGERLAQHGGWLAISGGAPRGLRPDALAELARLAHEAGCRVAADTHGTALGPLLDARPELVKINRAEAAETLDVSADRPLRELAQALRTRTGGAVVLTDGADGSLGLPVDGEPIEVPAPRLRGRYPVGSGDSYLGGLLTALDRGDDLAAGLRLGTAAGVANAQTPGPGRFAVELVRELAGQ